MARIEFNKAGFEELRTSAGATELVKKHADQAAATSNAIASTTDPAAEDPYYEVVDRTTDRARFWVQTAMGEQLKRNVRHQAKTQALEKGI